MLFRSPDDPAEQADDSAGSDFEEATFVSSFADQFGAGDSPSNVLIDVIEFVAGDSLTGRAENLVEVAFLTSEISDCFYLIYEINDGLLVQGESQSYEGVGTGSFAFPEGVCPGGGRPPIEDTAPFSFTATVEGDTLTVTLSDPAGENLVITATRID